MLPIGTEITTQWSKVLYLPSTCITTEKNSQYSCRLKLSMADSEDEWKLLYVVRGYHAVWDPSQKLFNHRWIFFLAMPNFLSVGRTQWYRTTHHFCFTVHWHRMHLTFVCSSPSTGTCGATWTFSLSCHCFRADAISGSPHA